MQTLFTNILKVLLINLLIMNIAWPETAVKLSPKMRSAEVSKQEELEKKFAIWRKQFVDIQIIDEEQVTNSPRVVSDRKAKVMSVDNDEVYINKLSKVNYNAPIGVYRIGPPIIKQDTKKILGYPMYFLADAKLKKYNIMHNLSLVKLSSVGKEIMMGDRILNKHSLDNLNIKKNQSPKLQGQIISIVNGVKKAKEGDTLILDLGKENKIKAGNLLSVIKKSKVQRSVRLHEDKMFKRDHFLNKERDENAAKTVELPSESIATVLIYKVFNNSSLALVIDNKEPLDLYQEVTGYSSYLK